MDSVGVHSRLYSLYSRVYSCKRSKEKGVTSHLNERELQTADSPDSRGSSARAYECRWVQKRQIWLKRHFRRV